MELPPAENNALHGGLRGEGAETPLELCPQIPPGLLFWFGSIWANFLAVVMLIFKMLLLLLVCLHFRYLLNFNGIVCWLLIVCLFFIMGRGRRAGYKSFQQILKSKMLFSVAHPREEAATH